MSTMKHALGILCAGVLAFGAVLAVHALAPVPTAPDSAADGVTEIEFPEQEPDTVLPGEWQLPGRWRAPEPSNPNAYVEFTEYGLWFASDGCNTAAGTWSIDGKGNFDGGAGGAMTQIGCDNVPIPEAVSAAEHAEFDGEGRLVLSDADGERTVLERSRDHATTLVGRWVGPSTATHQTIVDFREDHTVTASSWCTELRGTWELAPADSRTVDLPADSTGAGSAVVGPGLLSIGSEPDEGGASCGDDVEAAPLPLANDTDYWFRFGPSGTFSVTPAEPAHATDQPITFYGVERPDQYQGSVPETASE